MFSYFRPNIFLFEDLGVKNGIKKLYGLKDLTNNFINQLKTKVEKCGTLFTFCM
jgi:3-methyladenine DNA glycosylase/8-oxoguanine DNA glycosylase